MAKKNKNKKVTVTVSAGQGPANQSKSQPRKKKSKRKSSASPKNRAIPAWLALVQNPFDHAPVAIPDQMTTQSVKYTSRANIPFNVVDAKDGTGSTVHGGLIHISPGFISNVSTNDATRAQVTFLPFRSDLGGFGKVGTGSAFPGYQVLLQNVPNANAINPGIDATSLNTNDGGVCQFRPTALGIRLTYLGTELNRAGKVTMGLIDPDVNAGQTAGTDCTNPVYFHTGWSSSYWTGTGSNIMTPQEVLNRMRRLDTCRVSDGVFELLWVPSIVPAYAPGFYNSRFTLAQAQDNFGSLPVIMIENDLTTSNSVTGSLWNLEIIWHWETLVASRFSVAVPPTPSNYDVLALEVCVNAFQAMSSSYLTTGMGRLALPDGSTDPASSTSWDYIPSAKAVTNTLQNINSVGEQMGIPNLSRNLASMGLGYLTSSASSYTRRGRLMR